MHYIILKNSQMSNFLLGGRMGDLVHALWVVKNNPGKHDLFITDRRDLHSDGFLLSLEETFAELHPIITSQDWCNSFSIYNNEDCTNLSMWRRYAYSATWTKLLSNTFNIPISGEPWIKVETSPVWSGKVIIHSSSNPDRKGYHWDIVLDKYRDQCLFIGNPEEYKGFDRSIPFYQPENLSEYCKFFIGNQSAPLAIAHSLGTPRLAMLNEIDKAHYAGEEKYHENYYWIAKETHFFEGLEY